MSENLQENKQELMEEVFPELNEEKAPEADTAPEIMIQMRNLKKYFEISKGLIKKKVTYVSPSRRARSSAWSASPAAARPPWQEWC